MRKRNFKEQIYWVLSNVSATDFSRFNVELLDAFFKTELSCIRKKKKETGNQYPFSNYEQEGLKVDIFHALAQKGFPLSINDIELILDLEENYYAHKSIKSDYYLYFNYECKDSDYTNATELYIRIGKTTMPYPEFLETHEKALFPKVKTNLTEDYYVF